MLREFSKYLEETVPDLKQQRLLIACSGGVDSVVLARLLHKLEYQIALAHCNFGLRGLESDADEAFARELAENLGCPFYVKQFDTKAFAAAQGLSTQMAARDLRYAWFEELKLEHYDRLLTAHHADDDLETFLIHLSRGSGLKGMTSIPEQRDWILRPFLGYPKKTLLDYAKKQGWLWREDSSNLQTDYLRNAIRLEVIPKLKQVDEDVLESFKQTKSHLGESQALIGDYLLLIQQLLFQETDEGLEMDLMKWADLPNKSALLNALFRPYGFTDLSALHVLPEAQSGKYILAPNYRLLRDRDRLILQKRVAKGPNEVFYIGETEKNIENPIRLSLKPIGKVGYHDPSAIYVDRALLRYPLLIRKWREGDRFQPFGMKGNKKISKFLKDEKLSLAAKEKLWLLCSEDRIVWVIGMRADERFKVTPATEEILKITYYP